LTKSSFKLDDSDIFYFNSIYRNISSFNLIPVISSFNFNDLLLENNFFFINLNKELPYFFSNNSYFWNLISIQDYKQGNNLNYFFILKKIKYSTSFLANFNNSFFYNRIFDKTSIFLNFYNFLYFNKSEIMVSFFFNSIFFKYFFAFNKKNYKTLADSFKNLLNNLVDSFFYSFNGNLLFNNLLPSPNFNFVLKKKMLKIFSYSKFSVTTTLW
jgi:hypothetical protein